MNTKLIQLANDTVEGIIELFYGYLSLLWDTLRSPAQGPIKAAQRWEEESDNVISPYIALLIAFIVFGLLVQGNLEDAIKFMREDVSSANWVSLLLVFFAPVAVIDFVARLIYWVTKGKIAHSFIRNALIYQFNPFFVCYFGILSSLEWAVSQAVTQEYLYFIFPLYNNLPLAFGAIYIFLLGAMLVALFGAPEKISQRKFALFFYKVFVGLVGSVVTFSILGAIFDQVMSLSLDPASADLPLANVIYQQCVVEDGSLQANVMVENTGADHIFISPDAFSIFVTDVSGDFVELSSYIVDSSLGKVGGKYFWLPGELGDFTLQASDGYYDENYEWGASWSAYYL